MKKTAILASAVATALMAGAASAESSVYGNIRVELQSKESLALDSGKMVFGFAGSEDLGNGMAAIYKIEIENDNADFESTTFTNDVSFVGLKGGFGQLTLGAQKDAAGFAIGGTDIFVNNSDAAMVNGAANGTIDNAVLYVNSFGAVTVGLGLTFDGDLTGADAFTQSDGAQPAPGNHVILAAMYGSDMFDVGFQMTSPDSDLTNVPGVGNVEDQLVVGGTIKLDGINIGISMADGNGFTPGTTQTESTLAIAVAIPVGGGTFKAGIQDMDDAAKKFGGNKGVTNVQYDYPLSKKVYTGVQYSAVDALVGKDPDDLIEAWLGVKF